MKVFVVQRIGTNVDVEDETLVDVFRKKGHAIDAMIEMLNDILDVFDNEVRPIPDSAADHTSHSIEWQGGQKYWATWVDEKEVI